MLSGGVITEECYGYYTYWYGWFMIVGLILPVFSFGALVLSCNDANCKRWGEICVKWCCCSCCRKRILRGRESSMDALDITDTKSTEESDPLKYQRSGYGSTHQQNVLELRQSLVEEASDIELSVSKKKRGTHT